MIIFHAAYDLKYFGYLYIDFHGNPFWANFRYVIVSLFLVTMGISLALVHKPKINWLKMRKRTLMLGSASLLISLVTYLQFPNSWIYFGIIHFILFSSWLGLLFLPYPRVTLFTAFFILTGSYFGWLQVHPLYLFFHETLGLLPIFSKDTVRVFPWFAAILIGISLVQYHLDKKLLILPFLAAQNKMNAALQFMGKHALIIYLIHQPILFELMKFTAAK